MENQGRRVRRRSRGRRAVHFAPDSSIFGNKCLITAALIFAFIVLQYNCRNCHAKQELIKITHSVEDIAKHLKTIQENYQLIENRLALYSKEIPKLEKQMSSLESLAKAIDYNRFGWNPRVHAVLPYVDVNLNHFNPTRISGNLTKFNSKQNLKRSKKLL